jgi:hypothetical protein
MAKLIKAAPNYINPDPDPKKRTVDLSISMFRNFNDYEKAITFYFADEDFHYCTRQTP